MELDAFVSGEDTDELSRAAAAAESGGYGGVWSIEAFGDPFLPLVTAAATTSSIRLGTNIAVAFARSPMTTAQTAHNLQRLSRGRLVLGLGTQVRAHIERRFSMPWSRPVERMREYVLALRAIWAAWEGEQPLQFEGEFYRHTLMTPNFDPGPTGYGVPQVYLAAVGPRMTTVAGEVADGLLCHPLSTPHYMTRVTMPALQAGRHAGARGGETTVVASMLAATGPDDEAMAASRINVRRKIAFYASTPAYLPVLALHQVEDLQPQLRRMAREGRWAEMGDLITDDIFDLFAVSGTPGQIGRTVRERFAGLAQRVIVYELDTEGRLKMAGRYLGEPEPARELIEGFAH